MTVRGEGKGGRNQEFAFALAREIDGHSGCAALCAGTDGTDGPTDAAGAYVDDTTIARAARLEMNARGLSRPERLVHILRTLG